MKSASMGDLALSFRTTQLNTKLKTDLEKLTVELSTGRKTEIAASVKGDLNPLISLERSLATIDSFSVANTEAALFASTLQASLEMAQDVATELGQTLLGVNNTPEANAVQAASKDARLRFDSVVSGLNTQVTGRYVLGGTATARPPLASTDDIMASLSAAVTTSGAVTAEDVQTVVVAWFDTPGGGFETDAYLGSTTDLTPFRISDDEVAEMPLRADDQAIRDLLKGFAMASLVQTGVPGGDVNEQTSLLVKAGEDVFGASGTVSVARASLGATEARINTAAVRNSSEQAAMQLAYLEITSADPFETAAKLESVQLQLEALYTLTARAGSLSLVDYLR
jgi:flagellar hook-associated protein 3 FlgL